MCTITILDSNVFTSQWLLWLRVFGPASHSALFYLLPHGCQVTKESRIARLRFTTRHSVLRGSEMGFLSSSSTSWNIMICFNVPDSIVAGLQNALPTAVQDLQGPYALHIPLLEQLTMLYDMSVGHVQGTVASIEKVTLYYPQRC